MLSELDVEDTSRGITNMTGNKFTEKRRFPRFRLVEKFRVKARVRIMGKSQTFYFEANDLSMGGVALISNKGIHLDPPPGTVLEVLLYNRHLSLRCVGKVVQSKFAEGSPQPLKEGTPLCVLIGMEIVGIDESSRHRLAEFLASIATYQDQKVRPADQSNSP